MTDTFLMRYGPEIGLRTGEHLILVTIAMTSDAAKYSRQWKAGFGHEFLAREDGYPGLAK